MRKNKQYLGNIKTVLLEEGDRKLIVLLGQHERNVFVEHQKNIQTFLVTALLKSHWFIIVDRGIRDISTLPEMPMRVLASIICPVSGKQNGGREIGVKRQFGNAVKA